MAHEIIYPQPDIIVEPLGDAILVKKCQTILYKEIFWNQTLEKRCFVHYPLLTATGEIKFLELVTRRIFNESYELPCEAHIYKRWEWGILKI